jgi:hypothetical protein
LQKHAKRVFFRQNRRQDPRPSIDKIALQIKLARLPKVFSQLAGTGSAAAQVMPANCFGSSKLR